MPCQPDLILSQVTIGTENCLHLSVYTHDLKPATLKPCMVYIHGGAFIYGAGTKDPYNPELLLRKDIVLVAINYRLGVFGRCGDIKMEKIKIRMWEFRHSLDFFNVRILVIR